MTTPEPPSSDPVVATSTEPQKQTVEGRPRGRILRVIQQVVRSELEFSGPLPPPKILAGYNEAFPGCAERIVAMAEGEQRHSHDVENRQIDNDFLLAKRGQLIGAGLALVFLVGGIFLIAIDKSVQGFALIGGAAAAFGGAFVYDRYQRAHEPAAPSGKTTQGLPSPPFEPSPDDDTNLPDART